MFAEHPDAIGTRSQAILKDSGVGGLRLGIGSKVQIDRADAAGLVVSEHVVNGDAGEIIGAEHVDGTGARGASGDGAGSEGLLIVSPVFFAQNANGLRGAEV